MNRENFQELMSEGRLLEIALQYLLESETQEKKERHTEHITGYIQERMERMWGHVQGPAEQAGYHSESERAYISEESHRTGGGKQQQHGGYDEMSVSPGSC